jgi:hypothetical protein
MRATGLARTGDIQCVLATLKCRRRALAIDLA